MTGGGLTVVPLVQWGLYVNARDAAGNVSQASTTVNVTPPACQNDTQAPTAPGGLTGSASGTSVTLRWTASTDNVWAKVLQVIAELGYRPNRLAQTPACLEISSDPPERSLPRNWPGKTINQYQAVDPGSAVRSKLGGLGFPRERGVFRAWDGPRTTG